MNKHDNCCMGTIDRTPSFADKCRQMEKDVEEQLLTLNIMKTHSTYLTKMVTVLQSLHEINKHH